MEYIITGIVVGMSVMLLAAWEYGKYRVVKKWWEEDDRIEEEIVLVSTIHLPTPRYDLVPNISLQGYKWTKPFPIIDWKFDFSCYVV